MRGVALAVEVVQKPSLMAKDYAALLDASPPDDDAERGALFVNRATELADALRKLAGRKRSRVWAIHGQRRSGKSHYARHVLAEVGARGLPYRCMSVNAYNRGSVRAVLREVYLQFYRVLRELALTEKHHVEERDTLLAMKAQVDLERTKTSHERAERLGVGGEWSTTATLGAPAVASGAVGARAQLQHEEAWRRSEERASLSDRDVVAVLERMARVMRTQQGAPLVLLLVDDLDLVDSEGSEDSDDSRALLEHLRPLAEHPDVTVVATMGNHYIDGHVKVLDELTELGPMSRADVREAWRRRVTRFHDGEAVFDNETLELLLDAAQGRIGLFFTFCDQVHRERGDDPTPLGLPLVARYARKKVETWSGNERYVKVLEAVGAAVRAGVAELSLDDEVRATALHLGLLAPVTGRPGSWAVNPLFARAFAP